MLNYTPANIAGFLFYLLIDRLEISAIDIQRVERVSNCALKRNLKDKYNNFDMIIFKIMINKKMIIENSNNKFVLRI